MRVSDADPKGLVLTDATLTSPSGHRFRVDSRWRQAHTVSSTAEPWPKRPWLAVMPTLAPST